MQNKKETVLINTAGVISPLIGATVTVTVNPGGALATLFADNGVTGIVNPMTTDANGAYSFYAANGRYTTIIAKTGYTAITRDEILDDPADANVNRGHAPVTVTPTTSPMSWTAPSQGVLDIGGGLLTALSVVRQSVTIELSSQCVPVCAGDTVIITYSTVPDSIVFRGN